MRTAFGIGVVAIVSVIGISAGVGDAQDKRRPQVRPGEPCCGIKSVDMRTKMVTVTEKATGCTYAFKANVAKDLEGLKVGGAIELDVKQLPALSQPKPPQGSSTARSAATSCGSNVPRDADTKAGNKCFVKTEDKGWVPVPCK